MKALRFIGMMLLLALSACGQCNEIHNPVQPGYPCGTRMHECSDGGCCWNNEDCGGDVPGCPEGLCCYRGDTFSAKPPSSSDAPLTPAP